MATAKSTARIEDSLIDDVNRWLRSDALQVESCHVARTFWQDRGHIYKIRAKDLPGATATGSWNKRSFILKRILVAPDSRDWDEDFLRRMFAFQVDMCFTSGYATMLPPDVPHAEFLASGGAGENGDAGLEMLLDDISERFPVAGEKGSYLSEKQVYAALDWLAKFHAVWRRGDFIDKPAVRLGLRLPPLQEVHVERGSDPDDENIWLHGGDSYLATRAREFELLKHEPEWTDLYTPLTKSGQCIADLVAQLLSPGPSPSDAGPLRQYETFIHGSAKPQNIHSTTDDSTVVLVNFQHAGLGIGVQDLASLFAYCVPPTLLATADGERTLLEYYRRIWEERSGGMYPMEFLDIHFETAVVDLLRFEASGGRGRADMEWLEARGRRILRDETWRNWLVSVVGEEWV